MKDRKTIHIFNTMTMNLVLQLIELVLASETKMHVHFYGNTLVTKKNKANDNKKHLKFKINNELTFTSLDIALYTQLFA